MDIAYTFIELVMVAAHIGDKVAIRGRLASVRAGKRNIFVVIRKQLSTIQVVCERCQQANGDNVDFRDLINLPSESVVDIYGVVSKPYQAIRSTTIQDVEIALHHWRCYSRAEQQLPFAIADANNTEKSESDAKKRHSLVDTHLKLDHPWLNYRAPVNFCVQKIQHAICRLYREYLEQHEFREIHTPKLLGIASEGGSEVFGLNYFGQKAFLAQSPQLYKQVMINSDFRRVYEIGPVFRAENSFSARHLCEFTALDLEMELDPNQDYHQILDLIWNLLVFIFDRLRLELQNQIAYIQSRYPYVEPLYPRTPLTVKFQDAVQMLREAGAEQDELDDLTTENERLLGVIIKQKLDSDLFILEKFPTRARPFYTMPLADDPEYSLSYDVIFRGQEISSGSQRINDYQMLTDSITKHGVRPETLGFYLESFKYGSYPHAGCGFGLERICSLYLNLGNVRKATLFPRDPFRIIP